MTIELVDQKEKLELFLALRKEYYEGKLCKIGLDAFPQEFKRIQDDLLASLRDINGEDYIELICWQFNENDWYEEIKNYYGE